VNASLDASEIEKMIDNPGNYDMEQIQNIFYRINQVNSKVRVMLKEVIVEDQRKGGFIRIYPNRGC
jgi:hypothetical protein